MTFKIASTRDLITASGEPCFPSYAFDVLKAEPTISWEWLDEDVAEITPDIMARYDGLHVNLPLVTAASAARDDCRCRIIARNGVGYDTVDLAAMTAKGIVVTNTPIAVRRPVAVATLTLAVRAGRAVVRQGQAGACRALERPGRVHGLRTHDADVGAGRRRQHRPGDHAAGQALLRPDHCG